MSNFGIFFERIKKFKPFARTLVQKNMSQRYTQNAESFWKKQSMKIHSCKFTNLSEYSIISTIEESANKIMMKSN